MFTARKARAELGMKAFTNPRPRHYARNRRNIFGPAGHGEPGPQADARLATGLPNGVCYKATLPPSAQNNHNDS